MTTDKTRAPRTVLVPRSGPRQPAKSAERSTPDSNYMLLRRRSFCFRDRDCDETDVALSELFAGLEHLGKYGW